MAEQATKPTATAAYPPPPPFWKHFTRSNIARFEEFKSTQTDTDTDTDINRLRENIPFDLRYLVPPPLPHDTYQLFGEAQEVNLHLPSLPSQSIAQLFQGDPCPSPQNYPFWLRTTAKYLLLNFLELSALLASPQPHSESQPSDTEGKLEDLRVLMLNAHHLLNAYRGHQARESVIGLLERQIAVSRGEVEGMEESKKRVGEVLGGMSIGESVERTEGVKMRESKRERERGSDDGLFEEEEEEEEEGRDGQDEGGQRITGGVEEWREMWEVLREVL